MGKRKKDLSEFGEFLVAEICKTGMSKVDFCTAVGINKPYFYESLAGTPPSQEILEKMVNDHLRLCGSCAAMSWSPFFATATLLPHGNTYRGAAGRRWRCRRGIFSLMENICSPSAAPWPPGCDRQFFLTVEMPVAFAVSWTCP